MSAYRTIGRCEIGADTLIDNDVIIGHPSKKTLQANRTFDESSGAVIGSQCILRSGTVVYEDVVFGNSIQTAHHVVVREGVRIGDDCVFGSATVVREGARLGRNVRLMEFVQVSEGAEIGDDVFIGPGTLMTAGRFMTGALQSSNQLSFNEAKELEGRYWDGPSVIIENDVRVGSGAVLLAGIRLGRGCVVAAGAVVSTNVPAGAMVAGNPARVLKHQAPPEQAAGG